MTKKPLFAIRCAICGEIKTGESKEKLAQDAKIVGWKQISIIKKTGGKTKKPACPACLASNPTLTVFGAYEK